MLLPSTGKRRNLRRPENRARGSSRNRPMRDPGPSTVGPLDFRSATRGFIPLRLWHTGSISRGLGQLPMDMHAWLQQGTARTS